MHTNARRLAFAVFLVSLSGTVPAQTSAVEQGSFTLYKFARAIGKETYSIGEEQGKSALRSDFLFTDRGTPVPLKATFIASDATHPLSLSVEGKSSRQSALKDTFTVDVAHDKLVQSRNEKTSEYPLDANTFPIDGYSPVSMQQQLLRFWIARSRPASIDAPPLGKIRIAPASDLAVTVDGRDTRLHGYTVSGLIWGSESLWLDDSNDLVALVSNDAEFDHFEAVRTGYEAALPGFIRQAVTNNLASLAQLTITAKHLPSRELVIANVTLIDGTGAPARKNVDVLVRNDRIARIAPSTRTPKATMDRDVIDGTGKFLIPGLWDMHAHYEQVEWGPIYLASGVTTVRDCGNEFDYIFAVRDKLQSGEGIGPRLLVAGLVDGTSPITLGAITADTPDEARTVVRRYKAAGALQIKIYSSMKPELVPVIAREAHKLGMTVTGHVPEGMTASQAIEAGYDGINHIPSVTQDVLGIPKGAMAPPTPDFNSPEALRKIDLLRRHGTVVDDTLALYEILTRPASEPLAAIEPGSDHVAPPLAAIFGDGVPPAVAERLRQYYASNLSMLRELHKHGIPVVAGTDQAVPGYSLHRELEIYVQAGFSPMEALQAATLVPARVMKLDAELGTLEPGKRADMVLLDADPLADIANTRRIAKTISGGAVYDPAPLWQSVDFEP